MKRILCNLLWVWLSFGTLSALGEGAKRWSGTIPPIANDPAAWRNLVDVFTEEKSYHSALAAALRLQTLFDDLPSKEKSYRTLIKVIDLGYVYPIRPTFGTADLEPSDDRDFANNYFFYKGWANSQKGLDRWADAHFKSMDSKEFPKYRYFLALEAYKNGKLDDAIASFKALLQEDYPVDQRVFVAKIARTLARVYFEKEEYSKSLDIYASYLLKLNPMTPSDWLEAAWNLYYLKRYDEALGYLFNLEAASSHKFNTTERFVLRALIHREYCSTGSIDNLLTQFENEYGDTIDDIKAGVPLVKLAQLKDLQVSENENYLQMRDMLRQLAFEADATPVPAELEGLAQHFFKTEVKDLQAQVNLFEDDALERSASQLITLHESIQFLGFDVEREAYSPALVFKKKEPKKKLFESEQENFLLRWNQFGEFWRDERLKYKANLTNECVAKVEK